MSLIPFVLLLIGLALIFLEFFLPGGIMAAAAVVILIASIVLFAIKSTSFLWTALYTACVIIVVGIVISLTIHRMRKGKFKGFFLDTAQNGYVASSYAKDLIGKKGEALSDLKPSGHILIEGKRYQAVSKIGYVEKGSSIEVIGGEGAHLIVKAFIQKD